VTEFGALERYAPALPLPRVAFIPGRTPRPEPAMFALDEALLTPERWRENSIWLHGVDLYNHGFAWEAHEAFEHLWRATADQRQREFFQALIQGAAAALKRALGEDSGSKQLAERAAHKLDALAQDLTPRYMGLDHRLFSARFRAFGASTANGFDARPLLRLF
jgi:uncharacterized protein